MRETDRIADPHEQLALLDSLYRQGKDTELLALIEELQAFQLLELECLIFAMRASFRQTDYADALRNIEKIEFLSDGNVEAFRTGGRIGNILRDEALALNYWERLARVSPNDREAALQSARIHLRNGRHNDALDWARKAIQQRPEESESLYIAVSAGLEAGWPEDCDQFLKSIYSVAPERGLKILSQFVRKHDCQTTARTLSDLIAGFPEDPKIAEIVNKLHSEWLIAGLQSELALRDREAAAYYRSAYRVSPTNPTARRSIDKLNQPHKDATREAFDRNDYAAAIECGLTALDLDPDDFEVWQLVGHSQFVGNNVDDACDAFRHCTMLRPEDSGSWLTYGLILKQGSDHVAAAEAFLKAKSLAPDGMAWESEAGLVTLLPLLVGEARRAMEGDRIETAFRYADTALKIDPDDAAISRLRQELLRRQRAEIRSEWNSNSDNVAENCRRYLTRSPNDEYVLMVFGRSLMRTRAYAEALPVWDLLSRLTPKESHVFLQLARCCRHLRENGQGIYAAKTALALDPGLDEARQILELLMEEPASLA